ncbi:MAG: hypothetical protein CG439_1781 [Methylococcaceae bacterium NSP1-2]|nr:hypothetical protein [Methylococcaceae bacterium]OYV17213.1 MAG: hypothetical protein CG439_1781 [Methylococcaceae bacterium NSP1-2]
MKCVNCKKDSKKQDREKAGGRCPSCHHPFVTEPAEDGLTDMAIKSAEEAVSSNGSLYFLKDHLKYQLHRTLKKKQRVAVIAFVIALLIFVIGLFFAVIKRGFFIGVTLFSGFAVIITASLKNKYKKTFDKLDTIINKWVTINPHSKLLTAEKYNASLGSKSSSNLDDISFERVLICERDETVDFLLSNLFHFHYSCPVLGGNGYPQAIYEDMLSRLKQNPDLKVFLLHDYSPAGYAFVRRIKTDPKWFGGKQKVNIIDLGLNINQKKLFRSMILKRPDRNKKVKETAELSLFQPAVLVALCGAAINEGIAMDLVTSAAAANNSSGYG